MSIRNGRISYDESTIRVLHRMRETLSELPPTNPARLRLMQGIRVEIAHARDRERRLSTKALQAPGFRLALRGK